MEKARPMREKMDGMWLVSRQGQNFDFDVVINTELLSNCTLTWRAKNYVSRQKKVQIGEIKVQRHKCY